MHLYIAFAFAYLARFHGLLHIFTSDDVYFRARSTIF